jgi:integrase/recombinase XerD
MGDLDEITPLPGDERGGELVIITPERGLSSAEEGLLPVVIARAGEKARGEYFNFFSVPIRNKHTRAAYLRAVTQFLAWCDLAGLDLELIRPIHVAAYMEKHPGEPLTKKQHLAAIRRFFSWYVVNGVLEMNPSRDVKLEKFSRDKGVNPVFEVYQVQRLLASIDTTNLRGLRDKTIFSMLSYTWCRVGAIVALNVTDYLWALEGSELRMHEKGGKERIVPVHHQLEKTLQEYLFGAGIRNDLDAPLFQSINNRKLTGRRLRRTDVDAILKARLAAANIDLIKTVPADRAIEAQAACYFELAA